MKNLRYARWCLSQSLSLSRLEAIEFKTTVTAEGIHDFRVAIRRARTLFRAYNPFMPKNYNAEAVSFRTINKFLGQARDARVSITLLKKLGRAENLENSDRKFLICAFQETERAAIQKAQNFLPRFLRAEKRISSGLSKAPFPPRLGRPYVTWVRKRLNKRNSRVAHCIHHIVNAESSLLHQTRIETKKIRYLTNTLPYDSKPARRILKLSKGIQSSLGEIQDLTRLRALLRENNRGHALLPLIQSKKEHIFHHCRKKLEKFPKKLKRELNAL